MRRAKQRSDLPGDQRPPSLDLPPRSAVVAAELQAELAHDLYAIFNQPCISLLNTKAVAKLAGVAVNTVIHWRRKGFIKAAKLGCDRVMFDRREVARVMELRNG